jgi:hypothetical protein
VSTWTATWAAKGGRWHLTVRLPSGVPILSAEGGRAADPDEHPGMGPLHDLGLHLVPGGRWDEDTPRRWSVPVAADSHERARQIVTSAGVAVPEWLDRANGDNSGHSRHRVA